MQRARKDVARRGHRIVLVLAACLAGALAIPAASHAALTLDAEPNDNLFQMNGPISRDGVVGTLATAADVDEFLVVMQPLKEVKMLFSVINAGTPQCALAPLGRLVHYQLTTEGGEPIVDGVIEVGKEVVEEHAMTTPGEVDGPQQLLRLSFFSEGDITGGCSYRFTLTDSGGHPSDAIDPTPLPPVANATVPEPNNLPQLAFGPLAGDTYYLGAIETADDVDWLRAWLVPGQAATLELGAIGGEVTASVEDPVQNVLLPAFPAKSEQNLRATIVGTPALNLIKIRGVLGARWRLRLSPADLVLKTAPEGRPPRPPRKKYKTGVTLRRGRGLGVTYVGNVTSEAHGCKPGRLVILRHRGTGFKRFTITRTREDGSFTLSRRTRSGGTVYAAVAEASTASRLCRFGRSPRVGA